MVSRLPGSRIYKKLQAIDKTLRGCYNLVTTLPQDYCNLLGGLENCMRYEEDMRLVKRFRTGSLHSIFSGIGVQIENNNVEHVEGLLDLARLFLEQPFLAQPILNQENGVRKFLGILIGHDAGEIVCLRNGEENDLAIDADVDLQTRKLLKQREQAFMKFLVQKKLSHRLKFSEDIRQSLLDYDDKKGGNGECYISVAAKLLDIVEGNTTALKYVFQYAQQLGLKGEPGKRKIDSNTQLGLDKFQTQLARLQSFHLGAEEQFQDQIENVLALMRGLYGQAGYTPFYLDFRNGEFSESA